ncbi:uncharacterized protein LOC143291882 [Babylonia areolata]|uniref:uncharacterized protein LOC143291882 n=1 Tax=Babylonia areolata TaxID=304850 RepID=UPI003FD61B7E
MGPRHVWLTLLWTLALVHQDSEGQRIRCDVPADVVFLLDASGSIKPPEWEQEKDFVRILIESLAVEEYAINVGLIVYSTEIGQVVDLQPFKNRDQLKAELPKLIQTRQGTDTARAIERMREMMRNQAREKAKKIAVVITDGRSENSTSTIQQAVYARQLDGITMIALGVGNQTFPDELEEVARSDYYPDQNRLFLVKDFTQLRGVVEELSNLICEVVPEKSTTTTPTTTTTRTTRPMTTPDLDPISCPRPADVVFLLDGSHSITDEDWARGRVFVTSLINSLEIDQEAIHAGIIVYSSNIGDTVPLKPFLGKGSLMAKASALNQPPLGRTNTALGLRRLRAMFQTHGRRGVPHIGLVITDGKSNNVQDTMDESALAKREGVVMVVVGVGKDTLDTELNAMATSPDTLFNVTDFSALFVIAKALKEIICIATDSTTPAIMTTTTTLRTTPSIPALCQECLVKGGVGYNSYPQNCRKYVVCYPEISGGYQPVMKDCPFGLFWSSEAVACVDAIYVNCPADPCRGHPEGWSHTDLTSGCGEYWVCRQGRSVPSCCPKGQRYSSLEGCFPDSGCRHPCSLQGTMEGSGACVFRPHPHDPFSYVKIRPGQAHEVRPCIPGTVYNQDQCSCVPYMPSLGCVPSVHYAFDGTFDDRSLHKHAAHVERVMLTNHGTAYFNGSGHVRIDTLPRDEFHNQFVLKIRYRVQPAQPPAIQWNEHYNWGLQEWFSTHQSLHPRLNLTFKEGRLPHQGPEPTLPSGESYPTLERVSLLNNGTVLYGRHARPEGSWPQGDLSGLLVTREHLGPLAKVQDTTVSGGVVYVPNHKGEVLVFSPGTSSSGGSVRWKIVSKNGRVMKSGVGEVPAATSEAFQFRLQPEPSLRWFIMAPGGKVLSTGNGPIPDAVKNLYAYYKKGKLVKVQQVGNKVKEWTVSRTDGSEATGGQDSIPARLRQELKLDEHLKPEGGIVTRWAVLSSSGHVLDSGTGDVPSGVFSKFSNLKSGLVLSSSKSHWQLKRPDGTPLLAGSGALPSGVRQFMKDSMVLPSLVRESSWTVELPNGTTLSGKGPIPEHIRRLFESSSVTTFADRQSFIKQQTRWYLMDGEGQVLESGYGEAPRAVAGAQADSKVVQQLGTQGSNLSRWEVRGANGAVLDRGQGQPPPRIFKMTATKLATHKPTILSGTNTPRHVDTGAGTPRHVDTGAGTPRHIDTGAGTPRHVDTGAGTPRHIDTGAGTPRHIGTGAGTPRHIGTGVGTPRHIDTGAGTPRHITSGANTPRQRTSAPRTVNAAKRSGMGGATGKQTGQARGQGERRWSVTLPDGSQRTGVGEVPSHLKDLLARQQHIRTTRRWTVTLPDGSQRSGIGEIPADIQALLDRQGGGGGGAGTGVKTTRRWTVTMPDGSTRSGTGEIPADIQALLDAQARRSSGLSGGGGRGRGPRLQKQWSVTLPNGTVTSGTGSIPAHLQQLLKAQRASGGLRTQKKWSVTLPDGSERSGVGEIPADLQALIGQGAQRRWSVKMPDGSTKSGTGPVPADLASLLAASGSTLSRGRRAAPGERYHDVVGNCGSPGTPSFLLSTSEQHVRFLLRTTQQRGGVTLVLPISAGMNDVQFTYDGKTLNGFSNGIQKSAPLTGSVLSAEAPVSIGECRRSSPRFHGEIEEVSISACFP